LGEMSCFNQHNAQFNEFEYHFACRRKVVHLCFITSPGKMIEKYLSIPCHQSINQSINGGDRRRHQSASMSVSYFLHSTHIQIQPNNYLPVKLLIEAPGFYQYKCKLAVGAQCKLCGDQCKLLVGRCKLVKCR